MSLAAYASDLAAPLPVVLCPGGHSLRSDLEFLREVRRTLLWPPPAAEMWNAIAGLRGSHDAPPAEAVPASRSPGRRSALLLEGPVTIDRARRAAASGAPRDWIVERVQRLRIGPKGMEELRRLGIRWAALDPVEVVALAANRSLARARARWARLLPVDVPVWLLASSSEPEVQSRK
jgi:hypothetical protein